MSTSDRIWLTGKVLRRRWKIPADHVLYREKGNWYHYLTRFPGAYCDRSGYVIFPSERSYKSATRYLDFGDTVHVPEGIKSMPGYIQVEQ